MKFKLLGAAAISPNPDWVLDDGGVWREVFMIDAGGKPTVDKARQAGITLVPPPDGAVWDNVKKDWGVDPAAVKSPNAMWREDQYIDGVFSKTNYTAMYPEEYKALLSAVKGITPIDRDPATISLRDGKYSLYFGTLDSIEHFKNEFRFPDRRWHVVFSLVVTQSAKKVSRAIKLYDEDFGNYKLPPLPNGWVGFMGVATVWQNGVQVGLPEVYFEAPLENLKVWAAEHALILPDAKVSYCGVSFDESGNMTSLKAVNRVMGDEV